MADVQDIMERQPIHEVWRKTRASGEVWRGMDTDRAHAILEASNSPLGSLPEYVANKLNLDIEVIKKEMAVPIVQTSLRIDDLITNRHWPTNVHTGKRKDGLIVARLEKMVAEAVTAKAHEAFPRDLPEKPGDFIEWALQNKINMNDLDGNVAIFVDQHAEDAEKFVQNAIDAEHINVPVRKKTKFKKAISRLAIATVMLLSMDQDIKIDGKSRDKVDNSHTINQVAGDKDESVDTSPNASYTPAPIVRVTPAPDIAPTRPAVRPSETARPTAEADPLAGRLRDPEYRVGNISLEQPFKISYESGLLDQIGNNRIKDNYDIVPQPNYGTEDIDPNIREEFSNYDNNGNWLIVTRTNWPNAKFLFGHSYNTEGTLGIGSGALPFHLFEELIKSAKDLQPLNPDIDDGNKMTNEFNGMEVVTITQNIDGEERQTNMVVAGAYRVDTDFLFNNTDVNVADGGSVEFRPDAMGMLRHGEDNPENDYLFTVACSGDLFNSSGDRTQRVVFKLVPADQWNAEHTTIPEEYSDFAIAEDDKSLNFSELQNAPVDVSEALQNESVMDFMRKAVKVFYPKRSEEEADDLIHTFPVVTGGRTDELLDKTRVGSKGSNAPLVSKEGHVSFANMTFHTKSIENGKISDELVAEEFLQSLQYQEQLGNKDFISHLGAKDQYEAAQIISLEMRGFNEIMQKKFMAKNGFEKDAYEYNVNGILYENASDAFEALNDIIESVTGRRYTAEELMDSGVVMEVNERFRGKYGGEDLWDTIGLHRSVYDANGNLIPELSLDQFPAFSVPVPPISN